MLDTLRSFAAGDEIHCVAIFRDAVRNGTAPHYSAREAAAWAPDDMDPAAWTGRLATTASTWIGLVDGMPAGFVTLRHDGYIDFLYVRPAARSTGLAARLYDCALAEARRAGHPRLTAHASHLARSFLAKRGWQVTAQERVRRADVEITRFAMELAPLP